jgi:hypothetical protein
MPREPKPNTLELTGTVQEISAPQFLQTGAEVQTIVVTWMDNDYKQVAAVDYYAKNGLDKLHKLEIKVGDTVKLPCNPSSKVKEGTGQNGPYRFWQSNMRGDAWNAEVIERAVVNTENIPF